MAKQTFTTGQVLTAAQMTSLQQTAMGGGAATAKTTSYVLTAADAGTVVQMNAAGATTITVNTALFAAGDTVQIQNIGAGVCTITAGTATVTTAGSLALSQWEGGNLYFTSTSASIFFDVVQSGGAAAFSGCVLTNAASQSISSSSITVVTFDTESLDTDGFHSTVTNTGRITIPSGKAGKYLFTAMGQFVNNGTGSRALYLYVNGTAKTSTSGITAGGLPTSMTAAFILDLAVADYVDVRVWQSSGGALNLNGNSTDTGVTNFCCTYLGA